MHCFAQDSAERQTAGQLHLKVVQHKLSADTLCIALWPQRLIILTIMRKYERLHGHLPHLQRWRISKLSASFFVLVFNPACNVEETQWVTSLINISSVFIWQHNTILSLLCLQCKNNSGMFIIHTYRYMGALVEKYFCISQSGISGITRVLSLTAKERTAEKDFGGKGQNKNTAFKQCRRCGVFFCFFFFCNDRTCYNKKW